MLDLALLKELCEAFGPTGCEDDVRDLIKNRLSDFQQDLSVDKTGNLILHVAGNNESKRVMLSAHMDEVGFILTDMTDEGYLKFDCVGGIDPRVLCGRAVTINHDGKKIKGVIGSKAIHHQTAQERARTTEVKDMYMDIGATSQEDAKQYAEIGDYGTFDSDFVFFGKDNQFIKAKAIDDRMGCAILIQIALKLKEENVQLPFDLYIAFTRCEEIGLSCAQVAAQTVQPDVAVVLEATAIGDIAGTRDSAKVAEVGKGGVLSLLDRSTIYDTTLVQNALRLGAEHAIPVQVKKWVSGGNDASHIHKSGKGVKCLALSAPTRYLHSPSTVSCIADYENMFALLWQLLVNDFE